MKNNYEIILVNNLLKCFFNVLERYEIFNEALSMVWQCNERRAEMGV